MNHKGKQLNFGLNLPDSDLYSLDRFYEGSFNKIPLSAAKEFGKKDPAQSLVITGESGSGKSHLLKGISKREESGVKTAYLDAKELWSLPASQIKSAIQSLEDNKIVCIDDIDRAGDSILFFDSLFHLFNHLSRQGSSLAVSMMESPAHSQVMPDYLASRLLSGMVVNIKKPADAEKQEIIKKIAADMQISLPSGGIEYILQRAPRSVGELLRLMKKIVENLEPGSRKISLKLLGKAIGS